MYGNMNVQQAIKKAYSKPVPLWMVFFGDYATVKKWYRKRLVKYLNQ
jgi:hypothetical protein